MNFPTLFPVPRIMPGIYYTTYILSKFLLWNEIILEDGVLKTNIEPWSSEDVGGPFDVLGDTGNVQRRF